MKLSFCTTCMNRTEHLKIALPNNMNEYILNNYSNYIESKTINYIKVKNKNFFDHRHAKNIAHKHSTGEILINLDADNILTEDVIIFIFDKFKKNMNSLLQYKSGYNWGFIAISKYNFFELGGYNEEFKNYGSEDPDLILRATKYLDCEHIIIDFQMLVTIEHPDSMRFENLENKNMNREYYVNNDISLKYLEKNIMNPNLYNNIDWGKI